VGNALVRTLGKPSLTKWAGENGAYEGERLTARIHRKIECTPSRRNPVLVYGPAKYSHQISFIPALMNDEELAKARLLSSPKNWSAPWIIMSVGRMVPEKGFDLALQGLAKLKQTRTDLNWRYVLVGDGQCRQNLVTQATELGIADRVVFTGALSFGRVREHYAAAHLVIMPGVKEGWPKVIAEAWAHGAIPVAARGGIVPHILRDEDAGVIFEPNPKALAETLANLLGSPERMKTVAKDIYKYCDELSLTQFKLRLEQVLVKRCGL
jgi:glycosyltransferase involved in cell wall biosynthesis